MRLIIDELTEQPKTTEGTLTYTARCPICGQPYAKHDEGQCRVRLAIKLERAINEQYRTRMFVGVLFATMLIIQVTILFVK